MCNIQFSHTEKRLLPRTLAWQQLCFTRHGTARSALPRGGALVAALPRGGDLVAGILVYADMSPTLLDRCAHSTGLI